MATIVEFQSVAGFILDDPIAGVLNNPTYTLDGIVWSDITDKIIDVTIGRGKSRDLDRTSSGLLTVALNNEERTFDPTYTAGPFYGKIVPRRKIRVTTDGVRQFTGVIDDWNFAYEPVGPSRAEIIATDDFTLLARQLVTAGTATPQATGARVNAVLDMVNVDWPAGARDISAGDSILGDDVFDGNALEYLQKVDTSEQGNMFIAKNGDFVFKSRTDATPKSDSLVTLADDGTGVHYSRVSVNYGTELLKNTAVVSSAAGTATAQDERSRFTYGISSEEIDTLVDSVAQLENLADLIVSKYADPEYRLENVVLNLDTMPSGDKATVLGLELGDVVLVKFTPNDIGNQLTRYGEIITISHSVEKSRHDISIGLASVDWTFLVLDDPVFGTMGTNHLAF